MIKCEPKQPFGFNVNDRVSHEKFGLGTTASVGYSANGRDVHIDVEFDEPSQTGNSTPTRFRKILSTYLVNLGSTEDVKLKVQEPTGGININDLLLKEVDDDEYVPTLDDEKEDSDDDNAELNFS